MNTSLTQVLRSRGFALGLHLAFWVILYMALSQTGSHPPSWTDERSNPLPAQDLVPVSRMGPLFSPAGLLSRIPQTTNDTSIFFTRYYVPPEKPPVPPPPTSRKIPLTYLGFYNTSSGGRQALFKTGGEFRAVPLGGAVLTNYVVAEIQMQMLLLTNSVAQSNLLLLNIETPLEVPLK